jgi:TolB protein
MTRAPEILTMSRHTTMAPDMVTRRSLFAFAGAIVLAAPVSVVAQGVTTIRLAIPEFASVDLPDAQTAHSLTQMIVGHLRWSGRYNLVALANSEIAIDKVPRFDDLRASKVDGLISGRVTGGIPNRMIVEFRLWDVQAGHHLMSQRYTTELANWRAVAQVVANSIHERLTGEKDKFQ